MEQPNPNDPSMVDVYDDASGEYVTTLPSKQPTVDPMTGQVQPDADPEQVAGASDGTGAVRAIGKALEIAPLASAGLQPGAADAAPAPIAAGIAEGSKDAAAGDVFQLKPGAADNLPTEIPGTPGGMQVRQEESKGLNPERAADLIGQTNEAADQDRAGILDEATARQIQLEENRKEQARLEQEVKQKQAANAIELKQTMDRRKKVEDRIAAVEAQEPDRGRAFPTGWSLVATYIGGIAAGMLQGLNGGRNQVLDSLMQRLDDDVKQQRITQSEQLKDLTRQLGSVDAAEDMLRAKQKEVVLKETEARLMGTANKVAPAQIDAFRKRMGAEITRHKVDAISKLDRDLTIQEVNTPGTAAQPFNAETFRTSALNQYAQQNGLKPNQAHDQWIKYNQSNRENAAARGALATAQRAIAKYEKDGDVSGFGFLGEKVPLQLAGKDAVHVRQVIGSLMSARIKQLSGSAASEGEVGRIRDALIGTGDFDSLSQGLSAMDAEFKNLDNAARTENPTFYRLQQQIRQLNNDPDVARQPGRAYQAGQVDDVVRIPPESRIAYEHNNPGNLTFAGQAGATRGEPKPKGGYWAKFENPRDGMVALNRQVQIDQQRGLNVRQFAEKYAPPSDDNATERWIQKFVTTIRHKTGATVDEQTPLSEIASGRAAVTIAGIESGARETK